MVQRRPMIAGNWKMYTDIYGSIELVKAVGEGMKAAKDLDVLVAPPFTSLSVVKPFAVNSGILLAGQNMHWAESGAYTGEISGGMLCAAGCTHVILGHSERRQLFGESDSDVDRKVQATRAASLIPIVCIGETIEKREAGKTFEVIESQLQGSLAGFLGKREVPSVTILAYEPVWAIGTGLTATPAQAQEVHRFIRGWIEKRFSPLAAEQMRILYGGSVKPENISDLMAEADIDGALVGGASLKADGFLKIIHYEKRG